MQKDRTHNPTARVLDILELLATADDGLNLTALAVGAGASKSTLFPIVKTLTARDYIRQDPDTMRYFLGIKCLAMAEAANMGNSAWLNVIDKEMRAIVNGCNEACQLGVLEGTNVVFIAMVQSARRVFQVSARMGQTLPAASMALGKALLADRSRSELEALYPGGLTGFTKNSVKTIDELEAQLELVRRQGFALEDRELTEETVCLAVSLSQRGHIIAALSVSIPAFRNSDEVRTKVLQLLFAAQRHIESVLGELPAIKSVN